MKEIAIIDDDSLLVEQIKVQIMKAKVDIPYHIDVFHDAFSFLDKNKQYDLILLDIEMPDMSGLELSTLISKHTMIIFITSYHTYMSDAFGINIFKYVLKENLDRELSDVFLHAMAFLSDNLDILVKSEFGLTSIAQTDIVVIKGNERKIEIWTVNNKKYIANYQSLHSLTKNLNINFIYVNRNTIVQKGFIQSFQDSYLMMKYYDTLIEVSRRRRVEVKQALYERLEKL